MQQRPAGVIVLGVLAIVWGVIGLCGSGLLLLGDTLLARREALRYGAPPAALAEGILIVTLLVLVQSLLYIVFGVGALQPSSWVWTLGVVLALIGLVVSIAGLLLDHRLLTIGGDLAGIAVDVVVLFYLFRPRVRQAFGQAFGQAE
jgi:hypothetical protein